MKKEELQKQIEQLKKQLQEERKKERIKKINEYRKQKYKQKVFYVPKEEKDPEMYIFLKLAKKLGIKTFKKEGDHKIYFVEDFLKEKKK
jgi:hypothetical protein